jgi:carbon starvation protein
MVIIVAILALVVVNALGESPWGVFSVGMTIPIALFMGVYLRFIRPGKVMEVSIIGFVLLMAAIIGGGAVAGTEWGAAFFHLDKVTIAWGSSSTASSPRSSPSGCSWPPATTSPPS